MAAGDARGTMGPRLAGRLTGELILRSPQYMNPLKQYELDLRGNKIASIENLGATENQFDSIDLSDNSIVRLEGFPKLPRLKQLLLNNNRIMRIAKNCHEPIPNLEVLMLTGNKLTNLQDLDPLGGFRKLTMLSLIGCPVVTKPNYRLYVISKCKALKVLDFKKVKPQERLDAKKLFPTDEAAAAHGAKTFEVDTEYEQQVAAQQQQQAAAAAAAQQAAQQDKRPASAEEMLALKAAIENATTMAEIRRLEEALKTGTVPSEFRVDSNGTGQQGPAAAAANGGDTAMEDAGANHAGATDGDAAMTDAGVAGEGGLAGGADGGEGGSKPEDMAVG